MILSEFEATLSHGVRFMSALGGEVTLKKERKKESKKERKEGRKWEDDINITFGISGINLECP